MTLSYGTNLGLLENAATGEAHDSALRALLRGVDGLVMPNVKGYLTNTPPGSPANGDCYIIGAAPSGAWAGKAGNVTRYSTVAAAWEFYAPKAGWMLQANTARESYRYTGSAWEIYYQEGTWTAALLGSTGSIGSYAASATGVYTRIGKLTSVQCLIGLSDKGSWTGAAFISGLPVSTSSSIAYQAATIGFFDFVTFSGFPGGYMSASSTNIHITQTQSASVDTDLPYANIANNSGILISATYRS